MILAGMGVRTVGDLLRHYPRRYIDRSAVERIRDLQVGEQATVIARVHDDGEATDASPAVDGDRDARGRHRHAGPDVLQPTLGSGHLQGGSGARRLGHGHPVPGPPPAGQPGGGDPRRRRAGPRAHGADHAGPSCLRRASPPGRSGSWCSRRSSGSRRSRIPMPSDAADAEGLEDLDTALRRVHFPEDAEQLARAIERLKFDELFTLELGRRVPQASARVGGDRRRASGGGRADRSAARDPALRADEGPDARDRGSRRRDGRRSPDERPPAGRRRLREDASWPCRPASRRSSRATRPPSWRPPRSWPPSTLVSVAALLRGVGAIDVLERGSAARRAPHGQGSLLEELAVTPSEGDPVTYALAHRCRHREGPGPRRRRASPTAAWTS